MLCQDQAFVYLFVCLYISWTESVLHRQEQHVWSCIYIYMWFTVQRYPIWKCGEEGFDVASPPSTQPHSTRAFRLFVSWS